MESLVVWLAVHWQPLPNFRFLSHVTISVVAASIGKARACQLDEIVHHWKRLTALINTNPASTFGSLDSPSLGLKVALRLHIDLVTDPYYAANDDPSSQSGSSSKERP